MTRGYPATGVCRFCKSWALHSEMVQYGTRHWAHPVCLYKRKGIDAINALHTWQIRHLPVVLMMEAGVPVAQIRAWSKRIEEEPLLAPTIVMVVSCRVRPIQRSISVTGRLAANQGDTDMTNQALTTLKISNPHGKNGRVWERTYETVEAAAEAIRAAYGWDEAVLSGWFADDMESDGRRVETSSCCVYETEADRDRDGDGSRAPWITKVRS